MRVVSRIMAVVALAAGMAAGVQSAGAAGAAAAPRAIDTLAQSVAREQSLREVKDVSRSLGQLAQFGRWNDIAGMFSQGGSLIWGDQTVSGHAGIANWFKTDAGAMNGVNPGSLDTWLIDEPIANLSADGTTAQARWSGMRFMGDGQGNTRIDGGIYENDYVQEHGQWKISTLHYYPQFEGDYANGWKNVGGQLLPIIPYHYSPDTAGIPIPAPSVPAQRTHETATDLAAQIARLNAEDAVRNLQDSYGYYAERRMWDDVVDMFAPNATVSIDGLGTFHGSNGVRQAVERDMGPAGLTQSTLNFRPEFDVIVDVSPDGQTATTRGTEVGMLEDPTTRVGSWQFSVFRNTFVNDHGIWKLKDMNLTPLITANYADGWGTGGTAPAVHTVPGFLPVSQQAAARQTDAAAHGNVSTSKAGLADLTRRLSRSEAYDGAENVLNSYQYYLDDLRCDLMGQIMATDGFKESPSAGYFRGPERVAEACHVVYGANPTTMRSSISYHWQPEPVILVSHDGRSAILRAYLFQPGTSATRAGGLSGAIYLDQFVLENGIWRAWDITIDEHYWNSANWATGWAGVPPGTPPLGTTGLNAKYPPDVALMDMGVREQGMWGGTGTQVNWPDIMPMWFDYRNLVSGRVPDLYQSDCAPCVVRPDLSMTNHGYELPPNGPEIDGTNVNPAQRR